MFNSSCQELAPVQSSPQLPYSVIVDRQNAQKFVLLCSLDSTLPKESSLLLHLFCQGQAKDLHGGANHSNIYSSRMNVQCDLALIARFQSRLHSLKYLWWHHVQIFGKQVEKKNINKNLIFFSFRNQEDLGTMSG